MNEEETKQEIQKQRDRYARHMHGMQAGVAVDAGRGDPSTNPKHLRVGVNSALVDSGTLFRLLIAKGIFTELEFYTTLADVAEEEHMSYEKKIGAKLI